MSEYVAEGYKCYTNQQFTISKILFRCAESKPHVMGVDLLLACLSVITASSVGLAMLVSLIGYEIWQHGSSRKRKAAPPSTTQND
jgi:hypothetical protein